MAVLANDIYIGSVSNPAYHYSNRSIALSSPTGIFSLDLIGNQLSIDTFSFTVRYDPNADMVYAPIGKDAYRDTNGKVYRLKKNTSDRIYKVYAPIGKDGYEDTNDKIYRFFTGEYSAANYLSEVPFGTPVYWYVSGSFFSKGYTKSVERISRYEWKVTCISGIGLLDAKYHVGGLYNGVAFLEIAQSIVGNSFKFTCDTSVANTNVYGHLPYDNARKNLHRLLFAVGAAMVRGTAGNDYVIKSLNATSVRVPSSRIALGGSVKVDLPADRVEVSEHSFYELPADETVTLFDNSNGQNVASNTVVVFNEPMHNLAVTGTLAIISSHVNYAIVSGVGVLTGKQYTHNETIISYGAGKTNVKYVKDNRLVSFANSNNIARRVFDFYSTAKTIKAKILLQNEKVGNNLSLQDTFGEPTTAYLEKMTVNVTSVIGATCELVENYTPISGGNNFENRAFISSSGTWTVPTGVNLIRIVLIGGGTGGYGGYDGANGMGRDDMYASSEAEYRTRRAVGYRIGVQTAAQGGAAGNAGEPGKYAIYDKSVTAGESITISVGAGGAGGARNGGAGSAGGNTTATSASVGSISSADGIASDTGYYDAIGGQTYATANSPGVRGGNGGMTDTNNESGYMGGNGLAGESVQGYSGGAGGNGMTYKLPTGYTFVDYDSFASGAGGGGAAYGANGSAGGSAYVTHVQVLDEYNPVYLLSGKGGNGANASPFPQANYGCGGRGGNGGGGAGNCGGCWGYFSYNAEDNCRVVNSNDGVGVVAQGGQGSAGGQGGAGCVIIYY